MKNNNNSNNSINNMDDSSSLGFSLSNKNNYFQTSTSSADSSHLSLFEAFTTASARVRGGEEEAAGISSATDPSIFTAVGSPKLEDFLGGSSTTAAAQQQQHQHIDHHHHHHFSTAPTTAATPSEIYDFQLKTIASSFFRGFATEQVADTKHVQKQQQQQQQQQQRIVSLVAAERSPKRSVETFGQRTSVYRGVTRHRWTGRYEAHLWDNTSRREGQSRKGRQVYLGGYDKEEKAARAYDLAALKYWGPTTATNFPVADYEKELEEMKNMTRQEFVASLRRKSSGFSRGASIYRGVTRHHQHGRWQARIGRVAGNKDLYLGTFSTQEEAAEAYDIAAIKFRGLNAVTNFDMSRYDIKSIANSKLPIGGITGGNKSKNSSESASDSKSPSDDRDVSSASCHMVAAAYASSHPSASTLSFAWPSKQDPSSVDHYSPNLLSGYQNNTTPTSVATNNVKNNLSILPAQPSYFQSPDSLDFCGNSPTACENNYGLFHVGNYLQQLSDGVSNTPTTTTATTSSWNNNIPFLNPVG